MMDLLYKKDTVAPISSIYVKRLKEPVLDINWHFHEEYELIYIIKGTGVRLVGDNLSNFQSGELVLVGSNLPHLWRTARNVNDVDRIIIKFEEKPFNTNIFDLPEFKEIRTLLKQAETGISFGEDIRRKVHPYIVNISRISGTAKWICLLNILDILSGSLDFGKLSSPHLKITPSHHEENRISKIINYIAEHYNEDLTLAKMADIASMTIHSFCRYFKKRTNKTFVQFLNEYRIGKACFLLVENKLSITQIWYELGFNSSTNFNKAFKRLYNCTPKEYRKKYVKIPDTNLMT